MRPVAKAPLLPHSPECGCVFCARIAALEAQLAEYQETITDLDNCSNAEFKEAIELFGQVRSGEDMFSILRRVAVQLAEQEAVLAEAGRALGPFRGMASDPSVLPSDSDESVIYTSPIVTLGDARRAAAAISSPTLARAVELDKARRAVCEAVAAEQDAEEFWESNPREDMSTYNAYSAARERRLAALARLRELEG